MKLVTWMLEQGKNRWHRPTDFHWKHFLVVFKFLTKTFYVDGVQSNIAISRVCRNAIWRLWLAFFDDLSGLKEAFFSGNQYIHDDATSAPKFPDLIEKIKSECTSPEEMREKFYFNDIKMAEIVRLIKNLQDEHLKLTQPRTQQLKSCVGNSKLIWKYCRTCWSWMLHVRTRLQWSWRNSRNWVWVHCCWPKHRAAQDEDFKVEESNRFWFFHILHHWPARFVSQHHSNFTCNGV